MSETRLPHPFAEDVVFMCSACGHEEQHEQTAPPALCPACGSVYYQPHDVDFDELNEEGGP